MANLADLLIVGAAFVMGLGHAFGYGDFETVVVWLLVYAVVMLVDIKTNVEGNA